MKVKMLQCMAGDRFVRNVGDEVEMPEAEAVRLIDAGFAVQVEAVEVEKKPKGKKKAVETAPEDGAGEAGN